MIDEPAHNPHDKIFIDAYSRRETAVSFLKSYLSDHVQSLIDFDSFGCYSSKYVDRKLKGYFSDLVYRFNFRGNTADTGLFILFEHLCDAPQKCSYVAPKNMQS